jgi:prepilin-type N-terminal cleavage/methylation domain-containing protein
MDLKRIKSKKGFTLIELMVVIVIIGILVAIALPNFIAAQDRAKLSSVKANMHTVQTMLETYAVDWGGIYANAATTAGAATNLKNEASSKSYWKDFKNPFIGTSAAFGGITGTVVANGATAGTGGTIVGGQVGYDPVNLGAATTVTKYYLYGGEKADNKVIVDKGISFYLTNS